MNWLYSLPFDDVNDLSLHVNNELAIGSN